MAEGFDEVDVVLFGGGEEVVELGRGGGCGLLEDYVLAGLQELFCVGVVVGVGRGDVDCSHVLVGCEGVEGGVGVLAVEFGGEGISLLLLAREDGVELPLVLLCGGFDECFCDPAGANGAEGDGHVESSRCLLGSGCGNAGWLGGMLEGNASDEDNL